MSRPNYRHAVTELRAFLALGPDRVQWRAFARQFLASERLSHLKTRPGLRSLPATGGNPLCTGKQREPAPPPPAPAAPSQRKVDLAAYREMMQFLLTKPNRAQWAAFKRRFTPRQLKNFSTWKSNHRQARLAFGDLRKLKKT